jgi:thiamine-monophosphate kinase
MCDVSDGLLQDLGHLARASGVRIVVDGERLPRPPGVSLEDALTGGEDHALVATVPAGIAVAGRRAEDRRGGTGRGRRRGPGSGHGAGAGSGAGLEALQLSIDDGARSTIAHSDPGGLLAS